ncbi:MAG: hypothetical protein HC795_17580 [Coleofasciculaceae cyanobacterium RL_1_1]|nr:hypothetical protein [Coleofasciculaceae cyanobacterium RL_1_1]
MNPNRFKPLQFQLPSLNSILFFVLLAWVLGAIGLGGLIKSLLVVIVVLAALPGSGAAVYPMVGQEKPNPGSLSVLRFRADGCE